MRVVTLIFLSLLMASAAPTVSQAQRASQVAPRTHNYGNATTGVHVIIIRDRSTTVRVAPAPDSWSRMRSAYFHNQYGPRTYQPRTYQPRPTVAPVVIDNPYVR